MGHRTGNGPCDSKSPSAKFLEMVRPEKRKFHEDATYVWMVDKAGLQELLVLSSDPHSALCGTLKVEWEHLKRNFGRRPCPIG